MASTATTAHIVNLPSYPVKGARGFPGHLARVHPDVGIIGNRSRAFRRADAAPATGTWEAKDNFYVGVNTASMVAAQPRLMTDGALDPTWVEEMARTLGVQHLEVTSTNDRYSMVDRLGNTVSALNLASVRALSEYLGYEVDPEVFRMDMWFDGVPAFAELDWISGSPGTRTVGTQNVKFQAYQVCVRCKAINANPATGTYDRETLQGLRRMMKERGYAGAPHNGHLHVMGLILIPLNMGFIWNGSQFGPVEE